MILVYLNQTEWLSRRISVFFFIDISNKNSMEIEREHKKITQCHPKIPTRSFYIKNVPFGSIIFPNLDMFDTQIMVYAEKHSLSYTSYINSTMYYPVLILAIGPY